METSQYTDEQRAADQKIWDGRHAMRAAKTYGLPRTRVKSVTMVPEAKKETVQCHR